MEAIRVGLVGGTGYSGMELLRLLGMHPKMDLSRVTSRREAGKTVQELFPYAQGLPFSELVVSEPDVGDLAGSCDVVFLAVPHGAAMKLAAELLEGGLRVVDLSADFRLRDPSVYKQWYGLEHEHRELLDQAVYGLPEFYSERIKKTSLVANPGCYPTSAILALAPALAREIVSPEQIVVDSKSGATGAGRGAKQANLFCEVHDNFRAYNLGGHRHTPEIEQELSIFSGQEMTISFNTHLLPTNRGILSTCYMQLKKDLSQEEIVAAYDKFYRDCPWVRVLPSGTLPETRWVRGTMFCDLGLVKEPRSNRLIAVSAIDNLCRGASAQAVANANLMFGLPVQAGLNLFPLLP
ncbi:MAG: N-acetyl-gamma-glutamyl-phosphate reductase [Desulfonatronovibrionaceae bacterium]